MNLAAWVEKWGRAAPDRPAIACGGATYSTYRQWAARPGLDRKTVHWFWEFGKPTWVAANLYVLTEHFDDFWVGTTLGSLPLGYYSRAFEFARYPRRVAAYPVASVFNPIFARLQNDRLRLSQAFYRAAYVIVRSGYFFAGAFALVIPEFIHLIIGDRWLPMESTFRLMLIYTLIDSVLVLATGVLFAVGRPGDVQRATTAQVLFFIPAVIVGALLWDINGVALAVDGMMLVGCVAIYPYLRRVADFSVWRLVVWPSIATLAALSVGLAVEWQGSELPVWQLAIAKMLGFSLVFGLLLLVAEHREMFAAARGVIELSRPQPHRST